MFTHCFGLFSSVHRNLHTPTDLFWMYMAAYCVVYYTYTCRILYVYERMHVYERILCMEKLLVSSILSYTYAQWVACTLAAMHASGNRAGHGLTVSPYICLLFFILRRFKAHFAIIPKNTCIYIHLPMYSYIFIHITYTDLG